MAIVYKKNKKLSAQMLFPLV